MESYWWVVFAFMNPFMWALNNMLDLYFTQNLFKSPYDGIALSAVYPAIFCTAAAFEIVPVHWYGVNPFMIAFSAGVLFVLACLFYYKSLFKTSDLILLQVLWNLNMVLVPILGLFLFQTTLSYQKVLGLLLVFLGANLLHKKTFQLNKEAAKVIVFAMMVSVFFASLGKLAESLAYDYVTNDFWSIYVMFCCGHLTTVVFLIVIKKHYGFFNVLQKSPKVVLTYAFFESCAILSSQKAISLAPDVSFVVAIESFTPVFVILISSLFVSMSTWLKNYFFHRPLHTIIEPSNLKIVNKVVLPQLNHWQWKMGISFVMIVGVYLVVV